ncbi:MAG TPA: type II toxin-antitoxin system HicB family antitoxin [Flavobacteriales bacterium]|nr:type II toxin-antitoxin system HicB family antitoxin [Flavobacteriales bacterium]HNI03326.1 type II toxin-antitoxin system HicB family antitoxin [Flavobacteriales bacterium]HNK41730.1 type II toxin-antitoxin system HicB family antitoxin [Flavobacteriales bacterium]HNK83863.1 type II toxin-antitoxin system HicB family antitoxin [Flavobacteriales bacterium]HNM69198.1 type II toxin-antitoxin system HicB family antitoxin [Flavobacteriales bacterium]
MDHTLQVIIEHDKEGYYAFVPELPGCHTQGDSLDEVMKNIKEAVDLYMGTLRPAELKRLSKKRVYTTSMPVSLG